jgi:hypothetical protein
MNGMVKAQFSLPHHRLSKRSPCTAKQRMVLGGGRKPFHVISISSAKVITGLLLFMSGRMRAETDSSKIKPC